MMNLIYNADLPPDKKKTYILVPLEDTSKYLSSAYLCVKDFFKLLRTYPDLLYKIISKAELKDVHNSSFVYFITNNFFNNILSSRTYSEELLFLLTQLLYEEISSLKEISDFPNLFDNSIVFALIKGFRYKRDVQKFFELVLSDIIEEYEKSENNTRPLIFKIENLDEFIKNEEGTILNGLSNQLNERKEEIQKKHNNEIKELKNMYKMKLTNYEESIISHNSSLCINQQSENEKYKMKESLDNEQFLIKYLMELNKEDLIEILKKETKETMKNYINEQLDCMNNENDFYSNSKLLDAIQHSSNVEKIIYHYKKNFNIAIDIIKKIIKKYKDNFDLIPYSIKYTSKIICLSLKKKFKEITNNEIYKIIAEFVFVFIFKEFFLNPDYGSLITTIIISKETKKNLMIIFEIWKKLISFQLYQNNNKYSEYTPFNWFFLDNINDIYELCQKTLDVNLPDTLIDHKNEDNKNNNNNKMKNTSFYSYSICYNIYNLTTLLNIVKNNLSYILENKSTKNEISEFEIVYNNLKEKKDIFKKLKSGDGQTVNYYIYYEVFYSKKFQDILFKTIKNEDIFSVKEIKDPKNDEEIYLNKIIRCKNIFCDLLFKSENLSAIELNNNNIDLNNGEQIIIALSEFYQNKSILYQFFLRNKNNDIDINYNDNNLDSNALYQDTNCLPLDWYSKTLLSCLQELNDDKKNSTINYKELILSLKNEINNTINKYNFEELAQALENLKNTRNFIKNFIEKQEKYNYLNINTKIRNFIESEIIDVEIKFKYEPNEKILSITKTEDGINSKFQQLDEFFSTASNKEEVINCSNIPDFIKKFPHLTLIAKRLKIDVFRIENDIKIKKGLLNYLKIVREHIKNRFVKEEAEDIYVRVKTTIMIRLYDKLFPKNPSSEDIFFYNQCVTLSWVEPRHLKQGHLLFDDFLPITSSCFDQINNEKSALGKLEVISKIFDAIINVIKFNKGGNFSADDIFPILEYALIKAHPKRLSSNLKYLQIFMKKDEYSKDNMHFDYLNGYLNLFKEIKYKDFVDINEEEFNRKCQEMKKKLEEAD